MTEESEFRLSDLPERLAKRIEIDPATGCWLWQGKKIGKGRYGAVRMRGQWLVHRLVYTLLVGPIPEDRPQLDHVRERGCIHKHCCWPAHLEPVTNEENIRRWAVAITHCSAAGHEFTPENTYVKKDGARACRACLRAARARYVERQMAQNPEEWRMRRREISARSRAKVASGA